MHDFLTLLGVVGMIFGGLGAVAGVTTVVERLTRPLAND